MEALVKYGGKIEEIELREIPKPIFGRDELLVKVMAAGICGTDLHILRNEYPSIPPVTLGHEYTGTVEAFGEDVKGFMLGDQIVSLTALGTCNYCYYCRKALYMLCDQRKSMGSGMDGIMAEYVRIPASLAYKVPPNMTGRDVMAISEPLACCIRAVIEKSPIKAGDIAVISGPGTIGQIVAQLAKIQGAYVIISGLGTDVERLDLAKNLGADVIASSTDELVKKVRDVAPNGADIVFECAGSGASVDVCLDNVRKEGHYAQVGLFGKRILMDMDRVLTKELSFSCSFATEPTSWHLLTKLLTQERLQLEPLISARLPLKQWREGFNMASNQIGNKIFLIPGTA